MRAAVGGCFFVSRVASRGGPLLLTVAGSDPTGGAGLQADIRTFESLGVGSASVVTALTVQTGREVIEVVPVAASLVGRQLKAVLAALPIKVVKCGMMARAATAAVVGEVLGGRGLTVVVDPVMRASGGERLGERRLQSALVERLFPLAAVVTVNLAEAAALAGFAVAGEDAMAAAAREIGARGPRAVVVKGGHLPGEPVDIVWDGTRIRRFPGPRVPGGELHGSGCAFASALAVGLARGGSLAGSVASAAAHVRALIGGSRPLGGGVRLRRPL